jgi:hypothetical protein
MGNARRQQEHLPLSNGDVPERAILDDTQGDVSFDLVEEFLAVLYVEVLPGVGTAHRHHHEF